MALFGAPAPSEASAAGLVGNFFGAANPQQQANNAPATGPAPGAFFGTPAASTTTTPSILGGGGSKPVATGSVFGAPLGSNTNNAGAATTTAAASSAPSLFGSSTAAAAPATNASPFVANRATVFGTPSASAAQSTSGSGASASTAQPLGAGLFGLSSANQTANLNTNAYNTNNAQQQQQQQQEQQKQEQQQGSGVAYFDSLLAKNKKQADGETALGDLPSLQLGLGDLRQKLKKVGPRPGQGQQDRILDGKAHYLLAASGVDPGAAVRDLGALGAQGRAEGRQQGWGGAGEVDVEAYLSSLQTKTTLSMIADGLDRSVRDFESFLEDNVTSEWEAQRRRIYQHFGIKPRDTGAGNVPGGGTNQARDSTQGGFGRSRRSKAAGQTGGAGRSTARTSAFGRSAAMQRSVIGPASRIGTHAPEFADVEGAREHVAATVDDRFLRDKQAKLAGTIHALNDARQAGQPIFICRDLAELEQKSGDRHASHVVQAYRAVMEMVGEKPNTGEARPERFFSKMYLDPNVNSPEATAMRKQILRGATRFLEKQFYNEINKLIAKYPQDAELGGLPDVASKIKSYVRLRIKRKTLVPDNTQLQMVNGEYVWAIVFFLLRAGFVEEAARYVNDNSTVFRGIDRTFSGYVNSYAASEDRRLKRPMQDRCAKDYQQRVRSSPEGSIDPFRMACYKIIGRCDMGNRNLDGLQTDVNDWIWLQFNLAREADRSVELAGESYGLAELQASIYEIGLRHFPRSGGGGGGGSGSGAGAGTGGGGGGVGGGGGAADDGNGSFGIFFYMQVLAGMFEQAIQYLYPFSYVDAVHFAIALTYYGLLRPAEAFLAENELLTHNTRQQPQINFGRMVGYYTRDFRAANVGAAVDYLVLICLNADEAAADGSNARSQAAQQQAALCYEALRELVLETREFSKLIGDIRPNGARIRGFIEERGSLIALGQEDDFVRHITLQAAGFADDNGRTSDAVLLYHLAGDYDTVVAILARALGEAIALGLGEDPMRLMPVKPRIGPNQNGPTTEPDSSLSLAAIDDPVELASSMMKMYENDYMFHKHVKEANRTACKVLLQMSEIRALVETGVWAGALDKIETLEILPLTARGDPGVIRNYAAKFAGLAQPVAANVPNLLLWTVTCCTRQRERLLGGQFSGNESTARAMAAAMKAICVDLTTYTSQLRYRFPPHLHEALARASAD